MQNKFIYIASPLKYGNINNEIAKKLQDANIDFFLPETINLKDALEHLKTIGDICFDNIDKSNIVIAVSPFGLSTASEIGYAINKKRVNGNMKIILFDTERTMYKLDAALTPYFDEVVYSVNDLVKFINK